MIRRASTIKENIKLNQFEMLKKHAPGDISPQKRKAVERIEKKKKTDEQLVKAIVNFINRTDSQILYLKLIKED